MIIRSYNLIPPLLSSPVMAHQLKGKKRGIGYFCEKNMVTSCDLTRHGRVNLELFGETRLKNGHRIRCRYAAMWRLSFRSSCSSGAHLH